MNADGEITEAATIRMEPDAGQAQPDGTYIFKATAVPCSLSGRNGCTVRIRPFHTDESRPFLPGLICWNQ